MPSKKVELRIAEALELQAELSDLLRRKSSMKLKLQLTEIALKVKSKSDPAAELLQQLFRDHGTEQEMNGRSQQVIKRFVEGEAGEETEHFKEYTEIHESKIEFECPLITMDLLEKVESDASYPSLVKLILDNELQG